LAESPAHRWGQIIGEVLEAALIPLLTDFAKQHGLYLDQKGNRECRVGVKCTWTDLNKNKHDLDFVLERGGTAAKRGAPAAFIETAWRRYTKHSRNKAQEIQGALMPLVETYRNAGPFTGVVLAGVFTAGAIAQLKSLSFAVLYFPYETVVNVFRKFSIDAAFDENTPDAVFAKKVAAYGALRPSQRQMLAAELLKANQAEVDDFMRSLEIVVSRQIERIIILTLHGSAHEATTVTDAITFVQGYGGTSAKLPLERFEIQVRYNNGDRIEATFKDKEAAIAFLRTYRLG
jgi:hypothetical protein